MFFFYNRYTCTATKSLRKGVTCEGCDRSFSYDATRRAQGFGDSWFCLDNAGAEKRATLSAERNCDKALVKAIDLVPCPHCGWYQKNMTWAGRRKRLWYTWLASGVATWCVFMWEFTHSEHADGSTRGTATWVFWAFIALGIAWFFAYNPNRGKSNR